MTAELMQLREDRGPIGEQAITGECDMRESMLTCRLRMSARSARRQPGLKTP
jgi:hypothetical protein